MPSSARTTDLTGLGVAEASALLQAREITAVELLDAHLARIAADGPPSFDGRPDAVNAFVRLYPEDAAEGARRADERRAPAAVAEHGPAPALCGIPVGVKDLYAVKGKPLTASSRVDEGRVAEADSDMWARLAGAGAVLVGHTHTHEWAAGGSTDQVGNPWALDRTAGGSSGGSGAALAAGMVPLALGSDTAGSLRLPSAICGVSTIKPTRGALSTRGILPLSHSLDHPGPMARTLEDCAIALRAMAAGRWPAPAEPPAPGSLRGARIAVSPRLDLGDPEADVTDGFERALEACRALGAEIVEPPAPDVTLVLRELFLDTLTTDMVAHHAAYADRRDLYRQSTRDLLEYGEQRAMTAAEYSDAQCSRLALTAGFADWLDEHRIDAVIEPTLPIVAPKRGHGYDQFFNPESGLYIVWSHYWDWLGLPVVALPSGVGSRTGLPVGVSLIGAPGADWPLLHRGVELQGQLGVPVAPDHAAVGS